MEFRFTPFNSITLLILSATLWTVWARFHFRVQSNWFAAYYLLLVGFWLGFDGSLNTWWILAGTAAALVLRAKPNNGARIAELCFMGYVLWRCVGLILLW